MSDFLEKLKAARLEHERGVALGRWLSDHGPAGLPIWDVNQDAELVEAITACLAMIPQTLLRSALVMDMPPELLPNHQEPSGKGHHQTSLWFMRVEEASDIWKQKGTLVRYIPTAGTYSYYEREERRTTYTDEPLILDNGYQVAGSTPKFAEGAMLNFLKRNRLF